MKSARRVGDLGLVPKNRSDTVRALLRLNGTYCVKAVESGNKVANARQAPLRKGSGLRKARPKEAIGSLRHVISTLCQIGQWY